MNNIYVDELPKDCGDCVFCKQTEYYYYCDKLHTKLGYFNKEKDCPLKPLTDRLAEERKTVVQEIREHFKNNLFDWYEDEDNANKELYLDADCVWRVLDQIEKEEKR